MKFTLLALSALAGLQSTLVARGSTEPGLLLAECPTDAPSTYAVAEYAGGNSVPYNYGNCLPDKDSNGNALQDVIFCQNVLCDFYSKPDCTGATILSFSLPVVAGARFNNLAGIGVGLGLAHSAECRAPTPL